MEIFRFLCAVVEDVRTYYEQNPPKTEEDNIDPHAKYT